MNSLKNLNKANTEVVPVPKGERQRRLHKAILRYHDPKGWPIIREALIRLKMQHLIGRGKDCLVPPESKDEQQQRPQRGGKPALTRHTGLNPAAQATARSKPSSTNGKANGKAKAGQAASKPVSPAAKGKAAPKGKPAAKTGRAGS
jgi:hypothetical protein